MNLKKLKSLLDNDDRLVAQFIALFKKQTPQQLAELSRAIKKKDWPTVSNTAHALKSQVKYLDLKSIAATAYTIEQLAEKEKQTDQIPLHFRKLERELRSLLKRF